MTDRGLNKSWLWKRSFGKGAGYIGGSTIFFSINCSKHSQLNRPGKLSTFRIGQFYFGWTQNWNIIPCCTH